ncbi:MAG: transglutaminase family protein [Verrucomicrobiota bacterium]|nr:transglutaminase family protein [Verrucomicrobiota bacterium]
MLIKIGYDITFDFPEPVPVMFALYPHPSRVKYIRKEREVFVDPIVSIDKFNDIYGNTCGRISAPAGKFRFGYDALIEDDGLPDPIVADAVQHDVADLPHETLSFLLGSRYCEVDSELSDVAWNLFGNTPLGWPRVQAICDFVHGHLRFDYQQARATRTALEGYKERVGVCRDFMHLAVTFCRCMNIPARYATGFLGDIGVVVPPAPMDFSAWFEVFLGGRWHTFDARHNQRRIGRVLMATGRDAADVALTTTFGTNRLDKFVVWTDEVTNDGSSQNGD